MASEQFSLCWDNFHKNMSSGMNSLLENEDLVDVTLAVEGKYLKAHKMVLSVCSPYFKELFKTNPCKHPIVFMKDVSYIALSDLLQFMYQGEVQVSQENLTSFIKTAEALQIKGLTGDGNGSTDDTVESTHEERSGHHEPTPVTVPRPKKVPAPPVQMPAPKRQRISSSIESAPLVHTPIVTKTEPPSSSTSNTEQLIQFKMEPYDHNQSVTIQDDGEGDTFDETLDDTAGDDNEEYSMMEGNEDGQPQAGTSTETAGEGQDVERLSYDCNVEGASSEQLILSEGEKFKKKIPRVGIVVDGFTYHMNTIKKNSVQYLVCSEYRRLVCKARAVLPIGGYAKDLVLRQGHNHPPLQEASAKDDFIRQLKMSVSQHPTRPLRQIYEDVSILYPEGAGLNTYNKVSPSMRRWRQAAVKKYL